MIQVSPARPLWRPRWLLLWASRRVNGHPCCCQRCGCIPVALHQVAYRTGRVTWWCPSCVDSVSDRVRCVEVNHG